MKNYLFLLICILGLSSCYLLDNKQQRDLADKEEYLKLKEQEILKKEKEDIEKQKKELEEEKANIGMLREQSETTANPAPPLEESKVYPEPTTSPDVFVGQFLRNLGNQQFVSAYEKCDMPSLKSFKNYNNFSSVNAYGGIVKVETKKLRVENVSNAAAKIYAYYYAEDPYNKNGNYEQYFHLSNKRGEWKITRIETINMNQF